MSLFYPILLSILYLSGAYAGRKDLFSPRFIYNVFAWIKNIPGILTLETYVNPDIIDKYFLYKFLGFLFVNLGITIYEKFPHKKYYYHERNISSIENYLKIGIVLFIVGAFIKYIIISNSGGILYIVTHIHSRKALLAGQHYNQVISSTLLTCSVLFLQYYHVNRKSKLSRNLFIGAFLFTLLCSMIFGARKPALMLVLQVLMFNHFTNHKYTIKNLLNLKTVILVFAVLMFMVMMPMLRSSDEGATLALNPITWAKSAIDGLYNVLDEFSYCAGDLFAFDYFPKHGFWNGQTYLNILVQWIPSSIYPNKPPMDDGMYLWNMMNGFYITPTTPTKSLMLDSSIPFTMEGALFANFGVLGIILGAFLIGILYQKTYKALTDMGCPILMLIIYQQVLFVFVPSVLHTTSVIIGCVLPGIIIYVLTRFRISIR